MDVAKVKPNYAAIAARDKQAFALAAKEGIGFVEAWLRVLDGQKTETSPARAPLFRGEQGALYLDR